MQTQRERLADTGVASCVRKGPVEGILIVNGRPKMERADMPCISFESILALQHFNESK